MWHNETYDEQYLRLGEKYISSDVTFDYIFSFLSTNELLKMREICQKFNSNVVNSKHFGEQIGKSLKQKIQKLKQIIAKKAQENENTPLLNNQLSHKYNRETIEKLLKQMKVLSFEPLKNFLTKPRKTIVVLMVAYTYFPGTTWNNISTK